jgi:hypothetical protein
MLRRAFKIDSIP